MVILETPITMTELSAMAESLFGDMVKAVADTENKRLALDAELHSDLESALLSEGSRLEDLWGFNLYPGMDDEDFIEFDSLINIRPRQNNRSREVENDQTRQKIIEIVNQYIAR